MVAWARLGRTAARESLLRPEVCFQILIARPLAPRHQRYTCRQTQARHTDRSCAGTRRGVWHVFLLHRAGPTVCGGCVRCTFATNKMHRPTTPPVKTLAQLPGDLPSCATPAPGDHPGYGVLTPTPQHWPKRSRQIMETHNDQCRSPMTEKTRISHFHAECATAQRRSGALRRATTLPPSVPLSSRREPVASLPLGQPGSRSAC